MHSLHITSLLHHICWPTNDLAFEPVRVQSRKERVLDGKLVFESMICLCALQYSTSALSTEFMLGLKSQSAVKTPRAAPFTSPQS